MHVPLFCPIMETNLSVNEFHQSSVHFLLHFSQFCIWRQVWDPICEQYRGVPPHVWTTIDATNTAATQDDGGDEVGLCSVVLSTAHHHTYL